MELYIDNKIMVQYTIVNGICYLSPNLKYAIK